MPRKIPNQEFLDIMKNKQPTLIPLDEYVNSVTSIHFKCSVCGHVFKNSPSRVLGTRKQGCFQCYAKRRMMSEEDFYEKAKANEHIEIIGKFSGTKKHIKVRCVYCDKIFDMRADDIIDGRVCVSCMHKIYRKPTEPTKTQVDFVNELKEVHSTIKPLGLFKTSRDKMLFECLTCNHKWEAKVDHVLYDKSGCPKCNLSKGEKRVSNYLKENNIEFESQYYFDNCKDKTYLPFDFYIPSKNICIEYDGEQHFREVKYFKYSLDYIQSHNNIKTKYCQKHNINLIRIPYTDFNNIEKILDKFILDN